jgi:hypothetical protein
MPSYAIISDIHSNLEALHAVSKEIKRVPYDILLAQKTDYNIIC